MTSYVFPTPRITQPWVVPFPVWCEEYAYYVDCVLTNLKTSMSHLGPFDWSRMRRDLERYLYDTGFSRFKSHHNPS